MHYLTARPNQRPIFQKEIPQFLLISRSKTFDSIYKLCKFYSYLYESSILYLKKCENKERNQGLSPKTCISCNLEKKLFVPPQAYGK